MSDVLVFPDSRAGLWDLVNGSTHLGEAVHAFYYQPADEYGSPVGPYPVAVIYLTGGSVGFIDRVDNLTVEVFAPLGTQAVETAESIAVSIAGDNIDTPSGFFDRIGVLSVPVDVPYPIVDISKAEVKFEVTSRPANY